MKVFEQISVIFLPPHTYSSLATISHWCEEGWGDSINPRASIYPPPFKALFKKYILVLVFKLIINKI